MVLFTCSTFGDNTLTIKKDKFGVGVDQRTSEKKEVYLYTISNGFISIKVSNYGAVLQSVILSDRGKPTDIILGYDDVEGYMKDIKTVKTFFGAIPARYANRIAKGQFKLDGKTYNLEPKNDNGNVLHGGPLNGLIWKPKRIKSKNKIGVEFSVTTPSGYWGFPGKLTVSVAYLLDRNNNMYIEYEAKSDKDTVINLTNHAYFNLNGQGNEEITNHYLKLYADKITPVNSNLIPTGELKKVENSPFDFLNFKQIGKDINEKSNDQIKYALGYDINFVLQKIKGKPIHSYPKYPDLLKYAAVVYSPKTGIQIDLFTTQPGVQVYTGNHLPSKDEPISGKDNKKYWFRTGLALETQHYPDSPNLLSFPSTTLKAGQKFAQESVYHFSITKEG